MLLQEGDDDIVADPVYVEIHVVSPHGKAVQITPGSQLPQSEPVLPPQRALLQSLHVDRLAGPVVAEVRGIGRLQEGVPGPGYQHESLQP